MLELLSDELELSESEPLLGSLMLRSLELLESLPLMPLSRLLLSSPVMSDELPFFPPKPLD